MTVENLNPTLAVREVNPETIQNPPTRQPYGPKSKIQNYLPALVIALISLLLFGLTRFGNFQSEGFSLLGQLRGQKKTIGDTLGFFFSDWGLTGRYYAPLPRGLFYFEYKFFQENAAGWHLVSAILHTGAALLVWWLTWRITRRPAVAGLAGLIFAILPGHVTVVADPVGQAELLATLFCLGSAICFVAARQNNRIDNGATDGQRGSYIGAVVLYGLALLCKQEALVLPLAFLGYDFMTGGLDRILHQETEIEEENDHTSGHLLSYYLPFLALIVIYLAASIAFFGGLSVFTTNPNLTQPALTSPTAFTGQDTAAEQRGGLGNFLRGNLRYLAEPFGLGGTDGLILLAALLAFLALTGIQEWEAWQIFNPALPKVPPLRLKAQDDDDDEMDLPINPLDTLSSTAPLQAEPIEENHLSETAELIPAETETETETPLTLIEPTAPVADEPLVIHPTPNYWTLRVIAYGFLWTAVFLLPFILTQADYRTLYPASVGFAIFLATVLVPYGLNMNWPDGEKAQVRALFGPFELSFWLRMIAIVAVIAVFFATSVNDIDEWNKASKVFATALGEILDFRLFG